MVVQLNSSINTYINSISGIMNSLTALGYNNDLYGLQQRGEEITNATGKIIYANYVFNSLASKTSHNAFIELANAFALENTKAGVIANPSVHLRGIMSLVLDSACDLRLFTRMRLMEDMVRRLGLWQRRVNLL